MSKLEELRKELDKAHQEHLQAMVASKRSYAAVRELRRNVEKVEQQYAENNKTQLAAERAYNKFLTEYLEVAMKEAPEVTSKPIELDW